MYARVSRYEEPVERIDEDVRGASATATRVEGMPGNKGLLYLVDRETGRTMSITLWEDEASMRDSEAPASALREETSSAVSAKVVAVERYEVATSPACLG